MLHTFEFVLILGTGVHTVLLSLKFHSRVFVALAELIASPFTTAERRKVASQRPLRAKPCSLPDLVWIDELLFVDRFSQEYIAVPPSNSMFETRPIQLVGESLMLIWFHRCRRACLRWLQIWPTAGIPSTQLSCSR